MRGLMEVIRGSTKSAMAGDPDSPQTQHGAEKVGWGFDDSKRVGWPGGWPSCLGWSLGGDVARDMGDDWGLWRMAGESPFVPIFRKPHYCTLNIRSNLRRTFRLVSIQGIVGNHRDSPGTTSSLFLVAILQDCFLRYTIRISLINWKGRILSEGHHCISDDLYLNSIQHRKPLFASLIHKELPSARIRVLQRQISW